MGAIFPPSILLMFFCEYCAENNAEFNIKKKIGPITSINRNIQ